MQNRCGPVRRGIRLVEVLVVAAMIAILVGLLIPAPRRVREAAARTQSQNNLRVIGVAINGYALAYNNTLPNAGPNAKYWFCGTTPTGSVAAAQVPHPRSPAVSCRRWKATSRPWPLRSIPRWSVSLATLAVTASPPTGPSRKRHRQSACARFVPARRVPVHRLRGNLHRRPDRGRPVSRIGGWYRSLPEHRLHHLAGIARRYSGRHLCQRRAVSRVCFHRERLPGGAHGWLGKEPDHGCQHRDLHQQRHHRFRRGVQPVRQHQQFRAELVASH